MKFYNQNTSEISRLIYYDPDRKEPQIPSFNSIETEARIKAEVQERKAKLQGLRTQATEIQKTMTTLKENMSETEIADLEQLVKDYHPGQREPEEKLVGDKEKYYLNWIKFQGIKKQIAQVETPAISPPPKIQKSEKNRSFSTSLIRILESTQYDHHSSRYTLYRRVLELNNRD